MPRGPPRPQVEARAISRYGTGRARGAVRSNQGRRISREPCVLGTRAQWWPRCRVYVASMRASSTSSAILRTRSSRRSFRLRGERPTAGTSRRRKRPYDSSAGPVPRGPSPAAASGGAAPHATQTHSPRTNPPAPSALLCPNASIPPRSCARNPTRPPYAPHRTRRPNWWGRLRPPPFTTGAWPTGRGTRQRCGSADACPSPTGRARPSPRSAGTPPDASRRA